MHDQVTVHHCNDVHVHVMMHGQLPTRSSIDNDECHVSAFRPISEALVGHEPISDRVLVARLKAKP